MELSAQKFVGQIAYVAAASRPVTARLDLPRNRFIQKIYLRSRLVGDTDASLAPNEDNAAKFIKQVRLIANGNDPRIVAPLVDLHRYSSLRSGLALTNSLITTASQTGAVLGTTEAIISFTLHQGERNNALDPSALLPAHMFSSLVLEVDFDTDAAVGAASGDYLVTGGELTVHVKEASLNAEEIKKIGRFSRYYLSTFEKTVDATYAQFPGFQIEMAPGKIVRRVMFTRINNSVRTAGVSATPSGTYRIRVKDNRKDKDVLDGYWEDFVLQNKLKYGIAPDTGVVMLDLDEAGSLDARGLSKGQATIDSLNSSVTSVAKVRTLTEEILR